eukprot:CAMPEP_0197677596 /NCGR_PEP_ID=MMETSP1338-20131121/88678_1 /TAXON_ID=43686 ORGANISM="Pelagodinium beii, Strain RCC1491" /NCGR_SAMPLE_ID=MMETSP1338 /ASSEMBLY_ACC=CAM_ASM_000754 /LENGTH=47 /DNA_ID= /DNA_START= /DNA_END= /DNA_ORIENTATION=
MPHLVLLVASAKDFQQLFQKDSGLTAGNSAGSDRRGEAWMQFLGAQL